MVTNFTYCDCEDLFEVGFLNGRKQLNGTNNSMYKRTANQAVWTTRRPEERTLLVSNHCIKRRQEEIGLLSDRDRVLIH